MSAVGQLSDLSSGMDKLNAALLKLSGVLEVQQQAVLKKFNQSHSRMTKDIVNNIESSASKINQLFSGVDKSQSNVFKNITAQSSHTTSIFTRLENGVIGFSSRLTEIAKLSGLEGIEKQAVLLSEKLNLLVQYISKFAAIKQQFDELRNHFGQFIDFVSEKKNELMTSFKGVRTSFISLLAVFSQNMADKVDGAFSQAIVSSKQFFSQLAEKCQQSFPLLSKIPAGLSQGMSKLSSGMDKAFSGIKKGGLTVFSTFSKLKGVFSHAFNILGDMSKIPGMEGLAEKYGKVQKKISEVTDKVFQELLAAFLPILLDICEQLLKFLEENKESVDQFIAALGTVFSFLAKVLSMVVKAISSVINGTAGFNEILIAAIATVILFAKYLNLAFISNPIGLVIAALIGLYALFQDFCNYLDGGESSLAGFWEPLVKGFNAVKQFVMGLFDFFKNLIVGYFSLIWRIVSNPLQAFKDFIAFIQDACADIPDIISDAFETAWDWVLSGIDAVIGWIKDKFSAVTSIFSAIGSFFGFGSDDDISATVDKTLKTVSEVPKAVDSARTRASHQIRSAKDRDIAVNNHSEQTVHMNITSDNPHLVAEIIDKKLKQRDVSTYEDNRAQLKV
ncbi:Phage-related protein [Pragia fontium]|uniref:Phage-related protein n=1 Tax=Pragia fontium TaxID=82985 RepID=A0ABQ5LF87_9GAMM|nr:hypothetical protein [Pragia fontium]GKX62285.1 hypothetical protein SOASR032_08540 [Pragia fontium]SUB83217.1 Phage-related protein [Pragia fontium]